MRRRYQYNTWETFAGICLKTTLPLVLLEVVCNFFKIMCIDIFWSGRAQWLGMFWEREKVLYIIKQLKNIPVPITGFCYQTNDLFRDSCIQSWATRPGFWKSYSISAIVLTHFEISEKSSTFKCRQKKIKKFIGSTRISIFLVSIKGNIMNLCSYFLTDHTEIIISHFLPGFVQLSRFI